MRRSRAVAALAVAGAAALAGCSSSGHRTASSPPAVPGISPPLAGSVTTTSGVWATVAMGRLGDPVDTFWQLLHSADGTSGWTDDVAATAAATNGGVAIASSGSTLAAAVVPSQLLTFSPVVSTTDGGRHWATSLIAAGLARHGGSLALGQSGGAVALDGPSADPQVQASAAGLTGWRTITTASTLASTPAGRSCRLAGIDSVAYGPSGPLVGGICSSGGMAGLFRYQGPGGWAAAGPHLGQQFVQDPAEVLWVSVAAAGYTSLVAVVDHGRTELIPAWQGAGRSSWVTGPPLPDGAGTGLDSIVAGRDRSLWVLQGPPDSTRLDSIAGPGAAWQSYRTPPAGTATVAPTAGSVTALAVDGATLTVWTATAPDSAWTRVQVLQVPIQYGSSG